MYNGPSTVELAVALHQRFANLNGINDVPTETLRQLINMLECALVNRLAESQGYVEADYGDFYGSNADLGYC